MLKCTVVIGEKRRRTLEAVNHEGVAIVSSTVTTALSTVPLLFCVIVPFAKFVQIVAINTTVSILFTLTMTVEMLACMALVHFSRTTDAALEGALAMMVGAVLGATVYWVGGQLGLLAWQAVSTQTRPVQTVSQRSSSVYTRYSC